MNVNSFELSLLIELNISSPLSLDASNSNFVVTATD